MNKDNTGFIGIREIAKLAGVSTATVSRVMNHPEKCKPQTIELVNRIIEENNYVPNETARNIFSRSYNTLALFIFDIRNPFFTQLIVELNNVCLENDYTLLICDTENDPEKELAYLHSCQAKRCGGLIITEGLDTDIFNECGIPYVYLDRQENLSVTSENYHSVKDVIRRFYDMGHRKIAFIGIADVFHSIKTRHAAYADALDELGIPYNKDYVFLKGNGFTNSLGAEGFNRFKNLDDPPTAVFCANDMCALGFMREAILQGVNIPEDVSICGFDHVLDDYTPVPLTTIEQNIPLLAETLFQLVTNPESGTHGVSIPTTFIEGATLAAPGKK